MRRIKSFVIIDTNVFVSALLTGSGHPFDILKLVQIGNVIPIFDRRMLSEYYRVFHYEKFHLSEGQINTTLFTIINNGIFVHNVRETKEKFIDRDDIPFFEVKESSYDFSSVLVTGNTKHFPADDFILTPQMFLVLLDQMERFITKDFDYEYVVQQILFENLQTEKYSLGKDLIPLLFDLDGDIADDSFFVIEE